MNCYLINLDRSTDRLAFMMNQFRVLQDMAGKGGINLSRVSAVDAALLDEKTIAGYYDKDYFSFNATYFPNIVQLGGLSKGEIACFLSHRKCWEKIVDGSDDYAAVFEDDVIFSGHSSRFLQEPDWIPEDADIVKLEVMTRKIIIDEEPEKEIDGRIVSRFYTTNVGAAAYIISKAAAQKLLQMTERFYIPVDHVMFGHFFPYFEKLICYQVVPALCIQDKEFNGQKSVFGSTLGERDQQMPRRPQMDLGIKAKREIIRLYHQIKARTGSRKQIVNFFNPDEAIDSTSWQTIRQPQASPVVQQAALHQQPSRQMDCYLINLERSPDRLVFMQEQFAYLQEQVKKENINLIRVPAVDARQLDESTIARHYDKDHYSFNARYFPNVVPPAGLSKGEIACFLSHRKCWEKICRSDNPNAYAVVLEDDVVFSKDAAAFLEDHAWIPADADLVKLEVLTRKLIIDTKPTTTLQGKAVFRFYSSNLGTAAYIISKKAAEKLLQMTEKFYVPIDHVMFGDLFPYFKQLVCYQVMPALCIQDTELRGENSVFKSTMDSRKEKFFQRVRKKMGMGTKIKRGLIRLTLQMKARAGLRRKAINTFDRKEAFILNKNKMS